jgi:hypothetical protein
LLVPSVLLAAVGCADIPESPDGKAPSLYAPQVAPSALILSPESGEALSADQELSMVGRVSDADGEAADLLATWTVNGEVACADQTPDSNGMVACDAAAEAGEAEVGLSVIDADGLSASTSVDVTVDAGLAPFIEMSGPDSQKNYSDVAVSFVGSISGAGDLSLAIESSQDGVEAFEVQVASDGSFEASAILSEGDHIITAVVTDGSGTTALVGTTVFVDGPNSAPDCVIMGPGEGDRTQSGDATAMNGVVDDVDVGPGALKLIWSSDIDGFLGEGSLDAETGEVMMDAVLSEGTHALTLTAEDEVGAGCQDTIEHVVGVAPTVVVQGPSGMVDEGDLVDFSATIDGTRRTSLQQVARWSVDGEPLENSTFDSTGFTTLSTELPAGKGTVTVEVVNVGGWTIEGSTDVTVNGRPSAPIIMPASGSPLFGGSYDASSELEATMVRAGTDPEGLEVSHRYEWSVNGSVTSASTSLTFPAAATARGDVIALTAYANDGRIDSKPAELRFVIGNGAPEVASVSMAPSAPTSADTVHCSASASDIDGDGVQIEYSWVADGRVIGSGPTLPPGTVIGSSVLECVVEASDGSKSTTARSGQVLVGRSAPQVQGMSFDVNEVMTNTNLGADFTVQDFDKDAIEVLYSWTVNGVPVGYQQRLDGDMWFEMGDSIELTITPVDDFHRGEGFTISTVVGDAPMVAPVVTMEFDRTREGEDMVCVIDVPGYDPDGDAVSHSIEWNVDGELFEGDVYDGEEAGDTIDGADTVEDQEWACIVTATSDSDDATGSADRRIQSAAETAEVMFSAEEVRGADETCTGAELVADGTQTQPGAGQEYISVPLPEMDPSGVTEVTITVEAAACNPDEGTTAKFQWAIVGPDMAETAAKGSVELEVPADCSCPDVGEVVEMTVPVNGLLIPGESQLVFSADAESFALISDADDNVATAVFTY